MSVHARDLKGARYALWKNPENLTDRQHAKLAWVAKVNHQLFRAYLLKEQLREVFALKGEEGKQLLDSWLGWAQRCRIPSFVQLGRRISKHREAIDATLDHRLSNGLVESTNTKIRLLTRIESSCKSPEALIGFVMLPRRLPTLTVRKNQPRMIHEIRIAVTTLRSLSVWGPTASGVLNPCTSAVRAVRQRCSAARAGNAQRISSAARPSHSA